MEPWVQALLGSVGGGVALATVALLMGLPRMEMLQGITFSKAQKIKTWFAIFGVFTAFSFFIMSMVQP